MPQIGITVPGTAPDATSSTTVEFARRAEAAGLHSVWATDRIMFNTPDTFVTLGAMAAVTSTIRIGTSVLLGPLRPPLLVAKAAATADYFSDGRLILGLGVGSRPEDFAATDVPIHERGGRMEDLLNLLKLAWSGEPIKYAGRHFSYDLGPMGLLPPQGKKLPIWFGGSAEPVLRRVARMGDGFIASTSGGVEGFRTNWATIRAHAKAEGRDPATITPGALMHFSVDSNGNRAREAMLNYLTRSYSAARAAQSLGPMVGTPADLVAGAQAYFDAGVEVLILSSITANVEHLDRLLEDVVPHLPKAHARTT